MFSRGWFDPASGLIHLNNIPALTVWSEQHCRRSEEGMTIAAQVEKAYQYHCTLF